MVLESDYPKGFWHNYLMAAFVVIHSFDEIFEETYMSKVLDKFKAAVAFDFLCEGHRV